LKKLDQKSITQHSRERRVIDPGTPEIHFNHGEHPRRQGYGGQEFIKEEDFILFIKMIFAFLGAGFIPTSPFLKSYL
jgi:hypothetical protein